VSGEGSHLKRPVSAIPERRAHIAQDLTAGADGHMLGRVDIGQFRALGIAGRVTVYDMEEVAGHRALLCR
jgi:hypothetical protein